MNVYDFDDTIYHPYVALLFVRYCFRKHPLLIVKLGPKYLWVLLKYAFDKSNQALVAETLNGICKYLKDTNKDVNEFWIKYEKNFSSWYLKQRRPNDLVISGSPDYLLQPMAKKYGFKLICSVVDIKTGEMKSKVMMGREKARYIIEQDMPLIENFYSDSISDTPIALLAEHAFLVSDKATTVKPWPHLTKDFVKQVTHKIDRF